jgi:hypothetical protein
MELACEERLMQLLATGDKRQMLKVNSEWTRAKWVVRGLTDICLPAFLLKGEDLGYRSSLGGWVV